jgi:hypothetical protein
MILYFAMNIRGPDGENASKAKIAHNLEIAREKASVLKRCFPEHEWIVPHENIIVNKLHELGLVESQNIISAEVELIKSVFDGVVAVGEVHSNTGVAQEVIAAREADKFLCFLDDTDEGSRQHLAEELVKWVAQTAPAESRWQE